MTARLITREGKQVVDDEAHDLAEWRQLISATATGVAIWIGAMVFVAFLFYLAGHYGWIKT